MPHLSPIYVDDATKERLDKIWLELDGLFSRVAILSFALLQWSEFYDSKEELVEALARYQMERKVAGRAPHHIKRVEELLKQLKANEAEEPKEGGNDEQ